MQIDTMQWHWPQYTQIILTVINLIACIRLHGTPRTGTYQIGYTFFGIAISYVILIAGGFFK